MSITSLPNARSAHLSLAPRLAEAQGDKIAASFAEFAHPELPHVTHTLNAFIPDVSVEQVDAVMRTGKIMSLDVYHSSGSDGSFEGDLAEGQVREMLHRNWPMNPAGALTKAEVFGKDMRGASEMLGIVNRLEIPSDATEDRHLSFVELQRRGAPTPTHQQNATWFASEKDGSQGVMVAWSVDTRTIELPFEHATHSVGKKVNDAIRGALRWWVSHQMGADLSSKMVSLIDVLKANNVQLKDSKPLGAARKKYHHGGAARRFLFPTRLQTVPHVGPADASKEALGRIASAD